jgi:tetratricopeptide (TPR) repeat protein
MKSQRKIAELMMQSGIARQTSNYVLEKQLLEQLVNLEPRFDQGWLNLGRAYSDLGEFEAAIFAFEKALALHPQYLKALYNLGIIYSTKLYDFSKAMGYFQKILSTNPNRMEAHTVYHALGDLYFFHLLDFERASDAYLEAQWINPGDMKVALKLKAVSDKEFQAMLRGRFGEDDNFTPDEVREYLNSGSSEAKTEKEQSELDAKQAEIDALCGDM